MKITFVISSLSMGGAEKIVTAMANYWVNKGWKITILTFDDGRKEPFYPLDSRVKHYPLGIAKKSRNFFEALVNNLIRLKKLREAIEESNPDLVISFMDTTNIMVLISTYNLNIPTIVSERIDPTLHRLKRFWMLLRKILYPKADALVVQSIAQRRIFNFLNPQITTIRNPAFIFSVSGSENVPIKKPAIVSVGRIVPQKGFDLLVRAFFYLSKKIKLWRLFIFGDGPEKEKLVSLINELRLKEKILLAGVIKDLFILKKADIFVLSSRYEGFPNALLEAMCCGLPCISFDCPSGPGDIIENYRNGILVPRESVQMLAGAMCYVITNPARRKYFAKMAEEFARIRFSFGRFMKAWEDLVEVLIK